MPGLSDWGWVLPSWSFTNFRGDPIDCYVPGVPLLVKLEQDGFHGFVVKVRLALTTAWNFG